MATTISILGGVGLFLLGMTVMTDGLKGRWSRSGS
jgi:phosphate:Na+ symporter